MKWNWSILSVVVVLVGLAAALGSCSKEEPLEDEFPERPLFLAIDQEVVIPTSVVRVVLGGTQRMEADEVTVVLSGEIGGREVSEEFRLQADRDGDVGDLHVDLIAADTLWPRFSPGQEAHFHGDMEVSLSDALGISARGTLQGVSWHFIRDLSPELSANVPSTVFANATIEVEGSGILRPEEGQTWAVIDSGSMSTDRGHEIDLSGQRLPVLWQGTRSLGGLRLDPTVIGVHPGQLVASFQFENEFSNATTQIGSGSGTIDSRLEQTFIARLTPEGGSRGQKIEIQGRGFVPGGESSDVGMLLRFEGTLTPRDTSMGVIDLQGPLALERVPFAVVDDERIEQNVWYHIEDRQIYGLGAHPGVFEGSITPIVYDQYGEAQGIAWEGEFEILPTRQVVYLKYLPAFSVALDRYGLFNVEREIRDRILEVVHRDYAGVNIVFVEEPPENFVNYATIELGGPDPRGRNAFGYDNTYNDQPKDTGNLHIDDYIGGINHQSAEHFNNPYGGIFVESFAFFSPTIHPENPFSSDHFNRVFGPFMPELGGTRVRGTEWPGGERSGAIAEAILVIGNVVGNTISHEIGHALGLTHFAEDWHVPGHVFHNPEPEGCIMDSGADRSFEQRAEIDGEGPAVFNERNRTYLEKILPVE